jgi:O-antigen biosynthesis protein
MSIYLYGEKSARSLRPYVKGKFIFIAGEKFFIRGVTYGTFKPDEYGNEFYDEKVVINDFREMTAIGINSIRLYTVPPKWFLDLAQHYGLRVMVGLPWEQHIAFLDNPRRIQSIEDRVRAGVAQCAGHPAILCYGIGNEIPSSIVRWYGPRKIEDFLKKLYWAAKHEDPEGLVTYVNYPSTEYLQLQFNDLVCFNLYLEEKSPFKSYISRLHNIAEDKPLIMTEIGLDSRRKGLMTQANTLHWQIRSSFASGCSGVFVFSWTDEWYRGGYDIEDWDFGLVERDRKPKPALQAAYKSFSESPLPDTPSWPRISVVVCSYNGERTIRECLQAVNQLEYTNYEVIVVDDGSVDDTAKIAKEFGFRVISTENRGLSSARNTGMENATGDIIAYIDDDAYPDPHWLKFLAYSFMHSNHVAVGGPNIPPPGDGFIADCVANSPGGPVHVLLSDNEAEHIPGCNMAILKEHLKEIGGFDPTFRVAGDDVDICWRLRERGWTIGFNPTAVVWHHRRNSLRAYWKQQVGYGKAESLLEKKWPEKYNAVGHASWAGRIYDKSVAHALGFKRERIYQGTWGTAPFQSASYSSLGKLRSLTVMPEWYLVILVLMILSSLGFLWLQMFFILPFLGLAIGTVFINAAGSAKKTWSIDLSRLNYKQLKLWSMTSFLHLVHPLARLWGRTRHGLTPWRVHGTKGFGLLWPQIDSIWSENWKSHQHRLQTIEQTLRSSGAAVLRGGEHDRWDLEVRGGFLGSARLLTVIEEHGAGKQLVRRRTWPTFSTHGIGMISFFAILSCGAAIDHVRSVAIVLGLFALSLLLLMLQQGATSMNHLKRALNITGIEDKEVRTEQQPLGHPELQVELDGNNLIVEEQKIGSLSNVGR